MNDLFTYFDFNIGEYAIQVGSIIKLALFVFLVFASLILIKKTINRSKRIDIAKKYSIYSLIKYFVLVFACIFSLQIVGFDLSVLIAGSAALLVGVGLGLQNLFSDFVSGIIILIDSTVKVNDIIEVNEVVCIVQEINMRTTTVLTREDKYIILPNSELTKSQLINWTHNHVTSRFEVTVGVDYSSDVNQVMKILEETAKKTEGVLKTPIPFVRFNEFGDSSLDFSVIFWSDEVFMVKTIKSDLRVNIFNAFKENGITIPFPQRVVHLNKS